MNLQSEESTLSQVLHDLTDVPGPERLADRALAGARGLRRRRLALTGSAAVAAVGALVLPFLLRPHALAAPDAAERKTTFSAPSTDAVASVPRSAIGPCQFRHQQVEPVDWPRFVTIAVDQLPQRSDYVMQSGHDVCDTGPTDGSHPFVAEAYAVISLGPHEEHGSLTVKLMTPSQPDRVTINVSTCGALRDVFAAPQPSGGTPVTDPGKILFCADGTATAPMVYGVGMNGLVTVTARYADHRMVQIESIAASPAQHPEIGVDDLRRVVADRGLAELLPTA